MLSPLFLQLEKDIGRAHLDLWRAKDKARALGLEGFAEDLDEYLKALEDIQSDLLKGRDRGRRRLV